MEGRLLEIRAGRGRKAQIQIREKHPSICDEIQETLQVDDIACIRVRTAFLVTEHRQISLSSFNEGSENPRPSVCCMCYWRDDGWAGRTR